MRGHPSGNRELLSFSAGGQPAGNNNPCGLAVRVDFDESLPIGPAELDAFEAFLMPQILALLAERPAIPARTGSMDSEVPQMSANTWIKAV
jgi:hypothetical protein